jgi:D-sedoheptulose 7-phosphate isomerase
MIQSYIDLFSKIISETQVTDLSGRLMDSDNAISQVADAFMKVHKAGGMVYLVGNGGSSGIISHSSIDFINACKMKAMPLTDNSILTCLANDYGYENVFSEGLKTLFTERDILIAVSSSGSSKNIRNAVSMAHEKGGKTVTFSGFKQDNPLRTMGDFNLWLDSSDYGKVEIGHALLLHILTDELCRRNMSS